MRAGKWIVRAKSIRDDLRYCVVRINERIPSCRYFYALDEQQRFIETHVLRGIDAVEIERDQIVSLGLNRCQKEIGLLDRITRLAEMISAPLVATPLRFNLSFGIFLVSPIANRRAMNYRHDAIVGGELIPIDRVSFERINRQRDIRILPRFIELGRLGKCGD
jgi:hypothetical protein